MSGRPRYPGEHGQGGIAPLGRLAHQGRVMRFDESVELCLLGLMALVGGVARAVESL